MDINKSSFDSLPNEIFLEIFLWVKAFNDHDGDNHFHPPACASLSQVSTHWRRLALADRRLWVNWPRYGSAAHWTAFCYDRSFGALLNLHHIIDGHANAAVKQARIVAFFQMARARSVLIRFDLLERGSDAEGHFPAARALGLFESVLSTALHLRHLHLENVWTVHPKPRVNQYPFQASMPLTLIELSLVGFVATFPQDAQFHSLCILKIQDASAWCHVDEMVQFLANMPNLEELVYSYDDNPENRAGNNNIPPVVNQAISQTHPSRCVTLPRLKRLELSGGFKSGALLLIYSNFAAQVDLHLGADEIYTQGEEHMDLYWEALQSHFADAMAAGHSYDVLTINNRIISPDMTRQTSPSSTLPTSLSLALPIYCFRNVQGGRVIPASCALYLTLPVLAGGSELHVTHTVNHDLFLAMFPTLPALRILVLKQHATKELTSSELAKCAQIFPALEILRLTDFDCDEGVEPARREKMSDVIAGKVVQALRLCFNFDCTTTWRRIEFERFRYGEHIAERIRSEPSLKEFNANVQITCTDCTM
ncbi:hypothetical protein PENSPDRAFT_658438 [Peniophora sp. CONT]|nr:hypothetical protein PENSPDRAFT_658438 [Peniophora sp. CONT]